MTSFRDTESGSTTIDRIYEAALAPDNWLGVVETLRRISGSMSGGIVLVKSEEAGLDGAPVFRQGSIVGSLAIEPFAEAVRGSVADVPSRPLLRVDRWFARRLAGYQGFVQSADVMSREELERDPVQRSLVEAGLEADVTLLTPTSGSEAVTITFQRRSGDGWYDARAIAALNSFAPHLSRASLIAARLGLEWAARTVSTLQAIGLPAAVLDASGRVLATNDLIEEMADVLLPAAFGHMVVADPPADLLLQQAIAQNRQHGVVRSIPVWRGEGKPAAVLHVVPLRRAALDIFSGGDILVAVTVPAPTAMVPTANVLTSLFDLTPAEARLATELAAGLPLTRAAARVGVSTGTARNYLIRIFRKTGTNQQGQLVALLKTVQPFRR